MGPLPRIHNARAFPRQPAAPSITVRGGRGASNDELTEWSKRVGFGDRIGVMDRVARVARTQRLDRVVGVDPQPDKRTESSCAS